MKSKKTMKNNSAVNDEAVNEWLRQQLEPTPEQVTRLVHRAMAAEQSAHFGRKRLWRPALLALAALLVLTLITTLLFHLRIITPQTIKTPEKTTWVVASITNIAGEVELRLHPNPAARMLVSNTVSGGQTSDISIFNSDGFVVAMVTNSHVRYFVVGGNT